MAVPVLAVDNLSVRFGATRAVSGVSFQVAAGETVSIVGESGSGKSVSSLAAMGLLPATAAIDSGSIRYQGRELLGLSRREIRALRGRDMAMIFQEPMTSLNPVLTIGLQLTEMIRRTPGVTRRQAARQAIELLDLVRIPDPARRVGEYPHNLSGGMRQRVMIAIAVACNPRLLIADEPTTALDVTIQAQILELIDRLRKELSMAVLLVTHDLGVVAQWADRVVVMYAGATVEQGPVADVLARPLHPYTRGLLQASPRIGAGFTYHDGVLPEIPGSIASAAVEPGCPFVPRCRHAEPACRDGLKPLRPILPGRDLACPVGARMTEVP